jgi:REP-associated tyrosine transposase
MPRIGRIVVVGSPHHVTQRGNYNQKVFYSNKDRVFYLKLLAKYSKQHQLQILAYCLMNNHVHFIVVPKKEDSMAMTFKITHMKYSQYFNEKRKIKGHLWQSRFYSCVMDERHAYMAARYVEQNPVKAKLINEAWEWGWSSAACHVGHQDIEDFMVKCDFLPKADEWKKELAFHELKPIIDKLELCTRTGRPFADFFTIKKLEKTTKRYLRCRRAGRPKKLNN